MQYHKCPPSLRELLDRAGGLTNPSLPLLQRPCGTSKHRKIRLYWEPEPSFGTQAELREIALLSLQLYPLCPPLPRRCGLQHTLLSLNGREMLLHLPVLLGGKMSYRGTVPQEIWDTPCAIMDMFREIKMPEELGVGDGTSRDPGPDPPGVGRRTVLHLILDHSTPQP